MTRIVMASRAVIPAGTFIDSMKSAYQVCEVKCMKHKIDFDMVIRKAEDMCYSTKLNMAECLEHVTGQEIKLRELRRTVGGYLQR